MALQLAAIILEPAFCKIHAPLPPGVSCSCTLRDIVMDSGDSLSHAVPIHEGYITPSFVWRVVILQRI